MQVSSVPWARVRATVCCVATSQIRTVRSLPTLASHAPSGAIANACTQSVWPVRVAVQVPETGFQTRTVPSMPALASQVLSGATANAATEPVWPVRVAIQVPETGPQTRTARGKGLKSSVPPFQEYSGFIPAFDQLIEGVLRCFKGVSEGSCSADPIAGDR